MSEFLAKELRNIKGLTYIVSIPVNEFKTIDELETFVKKAKEGSIGVVMHYETSNFHCGVVVQIYDKSTCTVNEFLGR
jgi:predicted hydrocarbon binding protein